MQTNALPNYDQSENLTGCCPRFKPDGWDNQNLHFEDKLFLRAKTKSALHVPINMGSVFTDAQTSIEEAAAQEENQIVVLSRDLSPWKAEHLFAVTKEIPAHEMVRLSGDFTTKVFEGPFKDAKRWYDDMLAVAKKSGHEAEEVYFFYTTCPKCAKTYGENYVVGFAKLAAADQNQR